MLQGPDPSWIKEFVSRYIRFLYQTDTPQQVHMSSKDTTTTCFGKYVPSSRDCSVPMLLSQHVG